MRVVSLLAMFPRWLALGLSLFGAQALAGYAPIPDGYVLLSTDTTNRYVVAGGARFFIPPAQWSNYSSATLVPLPQATINSYAEIPQEGTLLRQIGYAAIYVVVGEKFWWIPNPTELDYWDDWRTVNNIPNAGWSEVFYNYSYKILVQERTRSQIYLYIAGAKYPITNASDLAYYGGASSVKIVPMGTLDDNTDQPWCGALLRERSSSTVYSLGFINSSLPGMYRSPVTATADGEVPDGALSGIPVFTPGGFLNCIN
ncbi:hypothetical protein D7X30_15775 [Corallococcus sp. AB011P]|nr:hypothetical protein D7X30_15775 [Corallococcus sp. AB011P]RKH86930.1 hypothetical protein D7Y21_20035 [Corallococcus sp. AB045]